MALDGKTMAFTHARARVSKSQRKQLKANALRSSTSIYRGGRYIYRKKKTRGKIRKNFSSEFSHFSISFHPFKFL